MAVAAAVAAAKLAVACTVEQPPAGSGAKLIETNFQQFQSLQLVFNVSDVAGRFGYLREVRCRHAGINEKADQLAKTVPAPIPAAQFV